MKVLIFQCNSVQMKESNEDEEEDDNEYWNAPQDIEKSSESEKEMEPMMFDGKSNPTASDKFALFWCLFLSR